MLDKFKTVCADCGHNDVTWAVVNRGLLICDECCSVHRTLGRHISQLKSLTKGHWRSSLLNMVQTLSNGSINSLWEHTLNDSKNSKKKPQPGDPVHPNKADFIRAKHQDLAYIMKSRNSDSPEDLNQQLHSSVRTSNLETSLRLLIQGADPNYYHVEKGNNVIHVAAGAGQMEQIELLINYGADPNVIDSHGNTPAACARVNGFLDIEEKIIECMYEVTDTLCMYLCKRRSDHKTEHFFVPEMSECCMPVIPNKQIKIKLQELSNVLFEELTMDVFDEIDRRENECNFSVSQLSKLKDQPLVPFLPVNPELSTMRNQGRQKLARLSKEEFATLVWDILCDCRRRQNPHGEELLNRIKANISDEEPLYDSVASDDDYAIAEDMSDSQEDTVTKDDPVKEENSPKGVMENDLKSRLITSEVRISELVSQVVELQQKMDEMRKENIELRNTMQHRPESTSETDSIADVKPRPSSLYNIAQQYINSSNGAMDRNNSPDPEEISRKANQVTRELKELTKALRSIQYNGGFTPCGENVRSAIADLTAIFPQGSTEEIIRSALRTLNTNTIRLQAVCADVDANVEKITSYAFNIAKANRQIITHFQC